MLLEFDYTVERFDVQPLPLEGLYTPLPPICWRGVAGLPRLCAVALRAEVTRRQRHWQPIQRVQTVRKDLRHGLYLSPGSTN